MTISEARKKTGDIRVWILLILTALIPTLASCFVGVREPDHEGQDSYSRNPVYVSEAPPPPRTEERAGVASSSTHVWVNGSWSRQYDCWSWGSGRWTARPYHGAQWMDGRWKHESRGYVWVGGYWR